MRFVTGRRRWLFPLVVLPFLAASLLGGSPRVGDQRVPYSGALDGIVTVDLTGNEPVMVSGIEESSSHLGQGSQEFTSLDLSGFPLISAGTSAATAANGDQIFLRFTLYATGLIPTSTGFTVEYEGTYCVTGGTGRFDFESFTLTGHYGTGVIVGAADVDMSRPGIVGMTFANTFDGTIATVGGTK